MDITELKARFKDDLAQTDHLGDHLDDFIQHLESVGFFEAPASISNQNNYPGGLMVHSLAVHDKALYLLERFFKYNTSCNCQITKESAAFVALLHDVCKSDVYKPASSQSSVTFSKSYEDFPCGHGEKSVIMLLRMGLQLTDEEILAIRWHMGSNEANPKSQEFDNLKVAENICFLLVLLQYADTMSCGFTWNSKDWRDKYNIAIKMGIYGAKDRSALLLSVFETTAKAILFREYISESHKTVQLELTEEDEMVSVYCDRQTCRLTSPTDALPMKIEVLSRDCLEVAHECVDKGNGDVCMVNFSDFSSIAPRRNSTQTYYPSPDSGDDYFFRCSDYYRFIFPYFQGMSFHGRSYDGSDSHKYDRKTFEGIFSKNVTFFRGTDYAGYPLLDEPWKVNCLTVPSDVDRIRNFLRIAYRNKQKILIVRMASERKWNVNPKRLASIFKYALADNEFAGRFRTIYFAIPDYRGNHDLLTEFRKAFQ